MEELRRPVFAGDLPVKMDLGTAQYEAVSSGEECAGYIGGAGPDEEDCGCGGDGCGDGGCGGGCGGGDGCGCGSEMMMDEGPAGPAEFDVYGTDPVGDRDKTRDRSPRPDRKRLPWSFAPRATIAS